MEPNVRRNSSGDRVIFDVKLGDGAPFEVYLTEEQARTLARDLTREVLPPPCPVCANGHMRFIASCVSCRLLWKT